MHGSIYRNICQNIYILYDMWLRGDNIFIFPYFHIFISFFFIGQSRITLSFKENFRKISLPGVASALDIGFSNWSFEFITISLYTMTKSTCVIFILGFAILFDLEKMVNFLFILVSGTFSNPILTLEIVFNQCRLAYFNWIVYVHI